MVSLFDLLPFYVGAALAGVVWAMRSLPGTSWRWAASIAAAIVGWLLCRLCLKGVARVLDAKCKKRLKLMSLDQLEARLKDPGCAEMDLVLAEIRARGGNLRQYRSYVVEGLGNDAGPRRLFAFRAFREGFPQDLERIRDYTPYEPADKCRRKAERLHDA
jgi:hypothetical protein